MHSLRVNSDDHPAQTANDTAIVEGGPSTGRVRQCVFLAALTCVANLSQHLSVLRAKQVVVSRKSGNQVYYALRDPVLLQVLDLLKQYFSAHLNDTLVMLGEMDSEQGRRV